MNTAIIVAGGSSRRMGFDKLFASLHGKEVIAHSIAAFEHCPAIQDIIVVGREDRVGELKAIVRNEAFRKVSRVIPGGAERHLSVWEGLQAVKADSQFIAIHDGARPLTTSRLIEDCLKLAMQEGAACCAAPVPDTVKRASGAVDGNHRVTESVERHGLWAMQTPQIFSTAIILQAYASLIKSHQASTDEVSAVQLIGKHIALLRNDDWNFKITIPRDLELAEQVLALRERAKRAD